MATVERRGDIVWTGNLSQGSGSITLVSGAGEFPVNFSVRTGESNGKTSPEELIAAANATCYAMVLANMLDQASAPPEKLEVEAVCGLEVSDSGLKIATMHLKVNGVAPGIDNDAFQEMAQKAEANCPVSNAIRGNVESKVTANLQG